MASSTVSAASDAQLVRTARDGDPRAFEALIERHFGLVYSIACARLDECEAAEDLAQEVFLRASLALDQLSDPKRFPQWLAQITRNQAASWLRRAQRRSAMAAMVPLGEWDQEIPDPDSRGGHRQMETDEQSRVLWATVKTLPPEQREVVLLHYAEEMSATEIAKRLGVHRTTVTRQIRRALGSLRGQLEPLLRESAPAIRSPRRAATRTAALVAAAWALQGTARASLAAVAADTAPFAKVGILAKATAALAAGGKTMSTVKSIAVLIIAAAAIGGGAMLFSSGDQDEQATASQTNAMQGTPTYGTVPIGQTGQAPADAARQSPTPTWTTHESEPATPPTEGAVPTRTSRRMGTR